MKIRYLSIIIALVTLILVPGCREKEASPATTARSSVVPTLLHTLYIDSDDLLRAGKKEEATAMLRDALTDKAFAPYRDHLFTTYLRFLLHTDQIDEAKVAFMNMLRTEPENARPGFEMVYGYLKQKGGAAEIIGWISELLQQPLTSQMRKTARGWLLTEQAETGMMKGFADTLAAYFADEDAKDCAQMVNRLCGMALARKNVALCDTVLEIAMESPQRKEEAIVHAVTVNRILALLAQSRWDAAESEIHGAVSLLTDSELQSILANASSAARRDKRFPQMEDMMYQLLETLPVEKGASRDVAAREWVNASIDQGDLATLPSKLDELMGFQIPPQQLYHIISRHFYATVNTPDVLGELLRRMESIVPLITSEGIRTGMDTMMMEGYFQVDDFDNTLRFLETRRPAGYEEGWYTMNIAKVRAHKALAAKDADEAAKQFRLFMDAFAAENEEPVTDPNSKVVYSTDFILAKNTKHIGDAYRDVHRDAEAKAAYAEALGLYAKALEANLSGEATDAQIRKEMAEVPRL